MTNDEAQAIALRLRGDERVRVRSGNLIFTIVSKHGLGVRSYGCLNDGDRRVRNGYRVMSDAELYDWLRRLEQEPPR